MTNEVLTTRADGTQYISRKDIYGNNKCPFCFSTNIGGGSWSPDICKDCGAVYFWCEWHKEVT